MGVVTLQDVHKQYGVQTVLDDVSLEINAGETVEPTTTDCAVGRNSIFTQRYGSFFAGGFSTQKLLRQ